MADLLSVNADNRIKAAVVFVKLANRDLKRDIDAATRAVLGPVWVQEVQVRAVTPAQRAILVKGAKVKAGNPPVAQAATSGRKLKGGLVPADQWYSYEFGGDPAKVTTYQRQGRKGGAPHKVTRHTARQLPPRKASGRVAMPAFAEVAPRAVSLWVSLVVKVYNNAVNGGNGDG